MVAVELTNTCNLRCAKCPVYATHRAKGLLDGQLLERILQEIRAAGGPTEVALSGSGEPTLHPEVVKFVQLARAVPNVTRVGFATNAVALTPKLAEALLDAGLDRLKVSLDTDDPAAFLRLNRADAYATVVDNLATFCDLNEACGNPCDVTLKVTLYGDDIALGRRLNQQWQGRVTRVRLTGRHNWAGLRGERRAAGRTAACDLLWYQVQICWDGQITLCCYDSMEAHYDMGTAWTVDLSRYWQHDTRFNEIRRLHEAGEFASLPVCAGCDADQYHDLRID